MAMTGTVRFTGHALRVQLVPPLAGFVRGRVTRHTNGAPPAPARCRVQLFEYANAHGHAFPTSSVPVRWTWSDATGDYRFDGLDPTRRYGVIAYDHTGEFDPEIKLNITPEVL